jgi:hypothetical protein
MAKAIPAKKQTGAKGQAPKKAGSKAPKKAAAKNKPAKNKPAKSKPAKLTGDLPVNSFELDESDYSPRIYFPNE